MKRRLEQTSVWSMQVWAMRNDKREKHKCLCMYFASTQWITMHEKRHGDSGHLVAHVRRDSNKCMSKMIPWKPCVRSLQKRVERKASILYRLNFNMFCSLLPCLLACQHSTNSVYSPSSPIYVLYVLRHVSFSHVRLIFYFTLRYFFVCFFFIIALEGGCGGVCCRYRRHCHCHCYPPWSTLLFSCWYLCL